MRALRPARGAVAREVGHVDDEAGPLQRPPPAVEEAEAGLAVPSHPGAVGGAVELVRRVRLEMPVVMRRVRLEREPADAADDDARAGLRLDQLVGPHRPLAHSARAPDVHRAGADVVDGGGEPELDPPLVGLDEEPGRRLLVEIGEEQIGRRDHALASSVVQSGSSSPARDVASDRWPLPSAAHHPDPLRTAARC